MEGGGYLPAFVGDTPAPWQNQRLAVNPLVTIQVHRQHPHTFGIIEEKHPGGEKGVGCTMPAFRGNVRKPKMA